MAKRTVDLFKLARALKLAPDESASAQDIQRQIAKKLRIGYLDLDELAGRPPSAELVELLKKTGKKFITQRLVLPLHIKGKKLIVGFCNPMDLETRKLLQMQLPLQIEPVIIDEEKMFTLFTDWSNQTARQSYNRLEDVEVTDSVELIRERAQEDEEANIEAPPIVRLGNKIIVDAVKAGASDIHFEPGTQELIVRFRIDGVMCEILKVPVRLNKHLVSRFKVMAGLDIAERRKPQDGRMRARVGGGDVDLRISTLPTACGEKVVMRLLVQSDDKASLEDLGFSTEYSKKLKGAIRRRGRMILVTGPTGSGKTTTLYSLLKLQRDGKTNIVTVEDPVEYRMDGINQIQVKSTVGLTFASALRSILRQDPDVIMVGEIRDSETAGIAVQAALTGHLVLSSLHTNDVPSTIDRLRDLGVDNTSLASSLGLVMAQRLVRKACPECSHKAMGPLQGKQVEQVFAAEDGCPACRNSGYKGRIGVYSILDVDKKVEALVRSGASSREIELAGRATDYRSLGEACVEIVKSGVSTFDEVSPYIQEESEQEEADAYSAQVTGANLQQQQHSVQPAAVVSNAPAPVLGEAGKDRILLIEDDDDIRTVLAMMLEEELYEVEEASDGVEGLEVVMKSPPSIVLCDLMMPRMDGKGFLKRLRSKPQTKHIPVIILTANASEENELDLLDLGADDYISKTTSQKILLTRIRRTLAKN